MERCREVLIYAVERDARAQKAGKGAVLMALASRLPRFVVRQRSPECGSCREGGLSEAWNDDEAVLCCLSETTLHSYGSCIRRCFPKHS